MKLSAQVEILDEVKEIIKFKTQDSEKKFLDKKLRLEIRLEEVEELLVEEGKGKITQMKSVSIPDDQVGVEAYPIEKSNESEMSGSRGIGDH